MKFIGNIYNAMFGKASIQKVVLADLDMAQRELLNHQSKAEFHHHMTAYYTAVIHRLTGYGTALKEISNDDPLQSAPAALHNQQVGRRNP